MGDNPDEPNEAWEVVRNTPGVTGFVGTATRAVPLSREEEARMLSTLGITGSKEKPRLRISFNVGDMVQVTAGPFSDFTGVVSDLDSDKGKVKVLVSIFGRETPVELDFRKSSRRRGLGTSSSLTSSVWDPLSKTWLVTCGGALGEEYGKESRRHRQASATRGERNTCAARRACAGAVRGQYHGICQRIQRGDRVAGGGHRPGRNHHFRGPVLHLHHQNAARELLDSQSRGHSKGSGFPTKKKLGDSPGSSV